MLHQEDKTIICPYNNSHLIREKRMTTHLVKCRKNYPTQDYAICRIDSTHHVPKQELEIHIEMCPKRSVVDSTLVEKETEKSNIALPLPTSVVQSLVVEAEESWNDLDEPPYVPDCSAKNVLRVLKNAPRAQKREFQVMERRRLLDLQEKEKASGPIQREHQLPMDHETDSVRRPKNQSQAVRVSQQRMTSDI